MSNLDAAVWRFDMYGVWHLAPPHGCGMFPPYDPYRTRNVPLRGPKCREVITRSIVEGV